ncbi:MAG TPA: YaeQ family protein, partial [Polyangiales bacterium]|nr:YaeQ family protein [Polyangiales bacterium]
SDSDRGVYETLELRVARHPSETLPYMLTRVLAYCLFWHPDIAFSKGLSEADEPAVWIRTLDGRVQLWIDVGQPSADRIHRASKASERVVVCTYQDPALLRRALDGERIHRVDDIELIAMSPALLRALEPEIAKRNDWELVVTGGQLYLTTNGNTHEAAIERGPLLGGAS